MAIGMGECREKVRSAMIEACWVYLLFWLRMGANGFIEDDSAGWEAAGGAGLRRFREVMV